MVSKKELRRYIATQKRLQTAAQRDSESAAVLALLERHPAFAAAETVLLYHSLPDEVDTHAFIQQWSRQKQVLLPAVVGHELELRRYTGPQDMSIGAYGIEEPIGERFIDYKGIDVVVVPGVAFDPRGNRLGRGKGYYDRLLPQLSAAGKVGVCFSFQLLEEVPAEAFDVCMDFVIAAPSPTI